MEFIAIRLLVLVLEHKQVYIILLFQDRNSQNAIKLLLCINSFVEDMHSHEHLLVINDSKLGD